jgi:hypothetical protein
MATAAIATIGLALASDVLVRVPTSQFQALAAAVPSTGAILLGACSGAGAGLLVKL